MADHPFKRELAPGQACSVRIFDCETGRDREILRATDILLEAPNWHPAGHLILNGDGILWRLDIASGSLFEMPFPGLPFLNNDHVLDPSSEAIYVSGYDWHIHRVNLSDGSTVQVTYDDPARPMRHFLHGVSPDGGEIAFVGIEPRGDSPWGAANIFTMPTSEETVRAITTGDRHADGCEYSPDGKWLYLNTELFSDRAGHAQIARGLPTIDSKAGASE